MANQDQLFFVMRSEGSNIRRMSFLVFNNFSEKNIRLEVGILSSFEEPSRPYAGIHVLADKEVPQSEIEDILEASGLNPKLTYQPFWEIAEKSSEARAHAKAALAAKKPWMGQR